MKIFIDSAEIDLIREAYAKAIESAIYYVVKVRALDEVDKDQTF